MLVFTIYILVPTIYLSTYILNHNLQTAGECSRRKRQYQFCGQTLLTPLGSHWLGDSSRFEPRYGTCQRVIYIQATECRGMCYCWNKI